MQYPHNKLRFHDQRNVTHADLYVSFLRVAYQDTREVVLTGHHFMCTPDTGNALENLKQVNEIPSADSLIFDHDMMRAVFGPAFLDVMIDCAKAPSDQRDDCLRRHFLAHGYSIIQSDPVAPMALDAHPEPSAVEVAENEGMPPRVTEFPAYGRPFLALRAATENLDTPEVWAARAQMQV